MNADLVIGLEVVGDAMAPGILEGDVLYIDRRKKPRANAQDIAVLKIEDEYHVCRYARYGKQVMLLHDNAPTFVVTAERIEVIGKVIGGSFNPVIEIPGQYEENQIAGNDMAFA